MSDRAMPIRLLLVDDDETFRRVMSTELIRRGYQVITASTGRQAIELAVSNDLDVILLDLQLPSMSGIDVLKALRAEDVGAGVIVLTGHGTIDTAIRSIRLGAADYLEKPSPIDRVEMAIVRTSKQVRLARSHRILADGYSPSDVSIDMIGESAAFLRLQQMIARVAPTGSVVLLLGETGVGKEMVAKLIHAQSPRREAPFVVVDCACLQEQLLQSELFGHEKGAFTGANRLKHGLFEVAEGGTLFFDEIGESGPEVQAKLLRVLESGRFRRLGGTKEISVDVRVVSATNRKLKDEIGRGHFREDLYFRLSTLTVQVPPLRDRQGDVQLLTRHFTDYFNRRFGLSRSFEPSALEILNDYGWPGNVRELIHVVEQSVVLCDRDLIGPQDLPSHFGSPRVTSTAVRPRAPSLTLQELEREHVLSVLDDVKGNRTQAASILGISERQVYRLLRRYRTSLDCKAEDRSET